MDSSRSHLSHDWHRTKLSPAIKWPKCTVFRATSSHWWPMYLVGSKSSEVEVKVSAGTIFSSCNIRIVWLHQIARPYTFTFHWLFRIQLVTNPNSQISEVYDSSRSEFFDVFTQGKRPSLDFKMIFVCLKNKCYIFNVYWSINYIGSPAK